MKEFNDAGYLQCDAVETLPKLLLSCPYLLFPQGPEYDPSVDFARQSSIARRPLSFGESSFDPSEASHASFDAEMYAAPSHRNSAAMSRPRSMWGATAAIALDLKQGRFVVQEVHQAAAGKLAVGDEVVKIDGLPLHGGMTLEEAEEMLAGPDGSMVELEIRNSRGVRTVEMSRVRRVMTWQDMQDSNGDSRDNNDSGNMERHGDAGGAHDAQAIEAMDKG